MGSVQVEGTAGEVQLALPPNTGEPIFPGLGVSTKGQKHNFLGQAEPANMSESLFSVVVLPLEINSLSMQLDCLSKLLNLVCAMCN